MNMVKGKGYRSLSFFFFFKIVLLCCVAWLPLGKDFYLILISSFLFAIVSHYLTQQSFGEISSFCQLYWYDRVQKRNMSFAAELGGQGASNNKN